MVLIARPAFALTDPTQPFGYIPDSKTKIKSESVKDMSLTAIFSRGNRSFAVINDQLVRVGDTINGYEIVQIDSRSVQLRNAQGMILLMPLVETFVKQMSVKPNAL